MSQMTDEEIRDLWKDPNFQGAFSGASILQKCIKMEFGKDVSQNQIARALGDEKFWQMHKGRPLRRNYRNFNNILAIGQLWQADIAFMSEYEGFSQFLLVIDCFSTFVMAKALKNRQKESMIEAFDQIFEENPIKPFKDSEVTIPVTEIETDRGKEFISLRKYFEEKGTYFKVMVSGSKACFAENMIKILKRQLYLMLKTQLRLNWVEFLPQAVSNYNNRPAERLGFLTPASVKSIADCEKVLQAREQVFGPNANKTLHWRDWIVNQKKYENNKKLLQVGDYVLVNFPFKPFDKESDYQVRVYCANVK